MSLFPMFLKLEGRRCLVVGAGPIGLEKIEGLLRAGAWVRAVSPEAVPAVQKLSSSGTVEWLERSFVPEDLDGFHLVIAATNDQRINRIVFEEASRRSILCNTVDDPPLCDFFFGSVVERGDLQIAISTAGRSPALAQKLRREIDGLLPNDTGRWLDDLGELRRDILRIMPGGDERKSLLHELAHRELCRAESCPVRQEALTAANGAGKAGGQFEEAPL
jgi:siroheme synthase-like protein